MEPLAIVGMGCRFPGGADSPSALWELLVQGVDAIGDIPPDRWSVEQFYDPSPDAPGKAYARQGGFIRQPIDAFDADFFGISPREAAFIDPQQRLLMEVTWEAFEDAGLDRERLSGSRTGAFIGVMAQDWFATQTTPANRRLYGVHSCAGISSTVLSNRLSYVFHLHGPSITIDTACSSSLVAIHYACQSIWNGECSQAIAGGVNLMFGPNYPIILSKGRFLSPDARCKAFDERANGYARGEGAGVVLLQPLSVALQEGRTIHALIRGSAVNQDGHTPGIPVPSQAAQEALLREALRRAGTGPRDLDYLEAHGTGTAIGDVIEAQSLGNVLGAGRPANAPLLIGSIKTNIGHTEAAAGVAGLIKAVLCLKHRQIPAHLHFHTPNPKIAFDALRIRPPRSLTPWPAKEGPACAGVNSFGFGGTNAFVVLEEGPANEWRVASGEWRATKEVGALEGSAAAETERRPYLLPLSAGSGAALNALAGAYQNLLVERPPLADLCYSASVLRGRHDHRLALVASTHDELLRKLEAFRAGSAAPGAHGVVPAAGDTRLVFVYTGMGPQWWAMGRELLRDEPVFRASLERTDALFRRHADWSLVAELSADEIRSRLTQTLFAQTGNFALQVALTELLHSWGIEPDAVVGHSVGEVAAAWAAGALDLEDAVLVSYHRASLQATLAGRGKMLAVGLGLKETTALLAGLEGRADVAAVNSPSSVTLSGEAEALQGVAEALTARGVFNRFLQAEVAYHSPQMEAIREPLLRALKGVQPRAARLPLFSTVTGSPVEGAALNADYWWRNARQAVRLHDAVEALSEAGYQQFLEVGPHPVLGGSIQDCLRARGAQGTVLPTLRRQQPERQNLLETLGRLFVLGRSLDWEKLWPQGGRRLQLPTYPWQRESYWAEATESREYRLGSPRHPLLARSTPAPVPTWEAELNGQAFPYLKDHQVEDRVIFPGAGYVEAGLAAALEVFGVEVDLEEIEIHKPLVVEAPLPIARLALDPASGRFTFHTRMEGDEPNWTLHASGHVLESKDRPAQACRSLAEMRARLKEVSVGDAYRWFAEHGLPYGPTFRPTQRLWRGVGEALAQLHLAPELHGSLSRTHCHPTLLDAGIQALLQAIIGPEDDPGDTVYLPVFMERVRFYARHGYTLWAYAVVTRRAPGAIEGDIFLLDENGTALVEVRGLRLQALPRPASSSDAWTHWLYQLQWEELPPVDSPKSQDGQRWLLVGGDDFGKTLAQQMEMQGATVQCIDVQALPALLGSGEADAPAWSLVYLGGLGAGKLRDDQPLTDSASGLDACAGLLATLQAFHQAEQGPQRLAVVTRSACPVGAENEMAPGEAALVGLARVIANERPDLPCRCIDLDTAAAPQTLCSELLATEGPPEIALRGEQRHAPRLRRTAVDQIDRPQPPPVAEAPALRLHVGGRGSLDQLVFEPGPRPAPAPGEVEVRIQAVGLNFKDVLKAMGKLSPRITENTSSRDLLGLECAGTVTRVGEGVADLRPGDSVVCSAPGCFATYMNIPRALVFKPWPGASHEDSATALLVFATAYYALHEIARLEKGESILIHAATGGVGLAAIQVARWKGATVFATAGSAEKRDYLKSLGVEHVMNSRTLAFADEIREQTQGRGVDVVLNSLVGKALTKSVEILAPYGRFVEIGKRDIDENNGLPLRPFNRNLSFAAIDVDRLWLDRPERMRRVTEELLNLFRQGVFQPLPRTVFPAVKVADAFRYLAQAKQIGKVVVSLRDGDLPTIHPPWAARLDATYLLTGGLGGVGLEAARWLVENGARHLVLIGRKAPTPEAQAVVSDLEARGVHVRIAAVDVADAEAVRRLFADIRERMPPLRGVLHLAAVLDDAPYDQLTRDRLARSLAPKAVGAWNLHQQTRTLPLDFFVLFSSISAVVGNPGQGNYVAANAFLDALAARRRATNLPALSIHWGALAGAGMLDRSPEVAASLELQGLRPLPIAEALKSLSVLLSASEDCVTVADVDWAKWARVHPRGTHDPRFAELVERSAAPGSKTARPDLEGLSEEERVTHIAARLRELIARVLQLSPEQAPLDKGLDQLGIDSLMAVELQTLIHTELGATVGTMDMMRGPTATQLAALILRQASPAAAPMAANSEAPADAAPVYNNGHHANGKPTPTAFKAPAVSPPTAGSSHTGNGADTPRRAPQSQSRVENFPEVQSLRRRIEAYEATGAQYPYFRVQESVAGPMTIVAGRERINYSAFNYLGLSGHPRVNQAAQDAITRYGTSVSASRLVSGERPIHVQLEHALAAWMGTDDALIFLSGYLTNVTVIGHLLGPTDVVFHDALVHNSALTGCKLSGARTFPFPHNDWRTLGRMLDQQRGDFRRAMIVLEGVYSMDGDYPDLPRYVELKKQHDALLMIDEAHSLGMLGATGRGIAEVFDVDRRDVDVWMGTLSKALASCGGFVAGSSAIIGYLRTTAPGLVYSVGLSPPDTAAALAALEVLQEEPERAALVQARAALFLRLAREHGLNTGTSGGTPVVPVITGNSQKAMALSQALFDRGVDAAPILFPAVEDAAARVRFFITCLHTEEQIRQTVEIVAEEWARLNASPILATS